jgi:uncharacterized protein (TIGR00255 family)
MTGFARVRSSLPEGELVVGIKSVNHRGLDIHFHMPPDFDAYESAMRACIKQRVARGHLQVHVSYVQSGGNGEMSLNRPFLQAYVAAFDAAARELGTDARPDLNAALRIPGMFRSESTAEPDSSLEAAVVSATSEALNVLNSFREREGSAIAADMTRRCSAISEVVERMEEIRSHAVSAFHKRLRERLADLLRGASLDPQRLAQEAAILADRSDISEELTRLKTHARQIGDLLSASGEIGKKLDFLLQEMNREANTILSKTGGLGDIGLTITDLALGAKAEIDKIREQSLNLE